MTDIPEVVYHLDLPVLRRDKRHPQGFNEPQVFTDAGDPEWKTVHRIAESQETLLAEAIVAAFAAARRGINEDTVALELMAHGNTGEIDWAALSKRLSDALASSIRECATQTALALLPRLRDLEPVTLSEPWSFWANNAVKGKKGFQPTGGAGDLVPGNPREALIGDPKRHEELPTGYLYHGTPDSNLAVIRQEGLKPGGYIMDVPGQEPVTAKGVFLANPEWPQSALVNRVMTDSGGMMLLRVPNSRVTDRVDVLGDVATPHAIRPADLQLWGADGKWHPLVGPGATGFSEPVAALLPRLRADVEPVLLSEPWQFWANNAIKGKKGFQPTGGAGASGGTGDEQVISKEWSAPPPPVGKAGEHKAGGYSSDSAYGTNTALGRVGEKAFVEVAGGKILHAPGKGEQSPLDVRIDGYGFEVKAVSTLSTKYAATPKPYEIAQKEAYAKTLGVKPATAIVVVDSIGGQAHAYWRPGLATGRLSENTGWKYLGSTSLAEQHTEAFADPVEQAFLSLSLVLRYSAAEDYLRTHLPTLVTNLTRETQEAIRDTILDGFQVGKHPRVMARQIKTMVGLTGPQGRTLDRLIKTWLDAKIPRANLDSNVRRTVDKMIRYRALNIARTETLRASNAGQQALWAAATNEGLLQRGVTRREWIATPSERTCPFCMTMDGQRVGMLEAFRSDRGDVMMPPLHPSCRCAMGIAIEPDAKPEVVSHQEQLSRMKILEDSAWKNARAELQLAKEAWKAAPNNSDEKRAANKRINAASIALEDAQTAHAARVARELEELSSVDAKAMLRLVREEIDVLWKEYMRSSAKAQIESDLGIRRGTAKKLLEKLATRLPLEDRILPRPGGMAQQEMYDTILSSTKAVESLFGVRSRWSGKVAVGELGNENAGMFTWENGISISPKAANYRKNDYIKVLIHEVLHGAQPLLPSQYMGRRGWEEGVVEATTQVFEAQIRARAGLPAGSGYNTYARYTNALESIRGTMSKTREEFYGELIRVPAPDREALVRRWIGEIGNPGMEALGLRTLEQANKVLND